LNKLILIALAGGCGALARYGLGGAVHRLLGAGFPWGTAAVNLVGCFLFGLVWSLAEGRFAVSGEARVIVLVGFMGAFTTFSTFIFETGGLLREAQWAMAIANLALQNTVGLMALWMGMALARVW
jgi:CrcB protein